MRPRRSQQDPGLHEAAHGHPAHREEGCIECSRHGRPARLDRAELAARPEATAWQRTHRRRSLDLQQAAEEAARQRATTSSRRRHAWLATGIGALVGPVLAVVSTAGGSPLVLAALPAVAWAWSPGANDPVRDALLIVGVGATTFGATWALLATGLP